MNGMDTSDIDQSLPNEEYAKKLSLKGVISQKCKFQGIDLLVKQDVFKQKLGFIGKLMKMQTNLRQNRELFIQLKGMCPDNKIPKGLLLASSMEIKDALEHFKNARDIDSVNERRPG